MQTITFISTFILSVRMILSESSSSSSEEEFITPSNATGTESYWEYLKDSEEGSSSNDSDKNPFQSIFTDEEDQKYAENRFLGVGPYHMRKTEVVETVAEFLNTTGGVCALKPSQFIVVCETVGNYRKSRFPNEPHGINETIVPEKCREKAVKFFWEEVKPVTTSPKGNYFTAKYYWANKTDSREPVVQARRCPTTNESPKIWLSDGREKRSVFVYIPNTRHHLRLDDYIFFAKSLYEPKESN